VSCDDETGNELWFASGWQCGWHIDGPAVHVRIKGETVIIEMNFPKRILAIASSQARCRRRPVWWAGCCRGQKGLVASLYRWRKTYAGISANELQRLKELEKENSRLKRLLAERMLENDLLKELLGKKG
jgi:hypothetical protein